jgi:hypothetical protein
MIESAQDKRKPIHFGLLLLISFVIFNLGYVVDQTVRWSDHLQGLMNGVFHVMFFGIAWGIYLLPWSLIVFALYRWRKWKRFRTHWVLAPAALALIASAGSLIIHPPTPSNRFKGSAKTELPTEIQNLHYHFSGGGIADYGDTYYFETTPDEVDRLIVAMNLKEDQYYGRERLSHTPVSTLPDCPDFSAWTGGKQYRAHDDGTGWFYYMIIDASKTKVYMLIGCI